MIATIKLVLKIYCSTVSIIIIIIIIIIRFSFLVLVFEEPVEERDKSWLHEILLVLVKVQEEPRGEREERRLKVWDQGQVPFLVCLVVEAEQRPRHAVQREL
jgi:hypothetical protein